MKLTPEAESRIENQMPGASKIAKITALTSIESTLRRGAQIPLSVKWSYVNQFTNLWETAQIKVVSADLQS